jgi:2-octaprenyl-6-methoxyphenol hydroxylase
MRYDVIIVGGGLVGASLAVALQHSERKVALVDARIPSSEDKRLFALNAASCDLIKNLGLWPELAQYAAPIHQVHVSNQGHFGAVRLRREDAQLSSLGHVVPAYVIESAFNDALGKIANLSLYRPAVLKSLVQHDGCATLTVESGGNNIELQAPVVIGADGTDSTVRKHVKIETETFDYQQSAIVTRTKLKRTHHHIAYERFSQEGTIAMLPLMDDECATIWTTDNEKVSEWMALSDADFLSKLQQQFGYRLGKLQSISERYRYPLRMLRAKKNRDGGVLLIGNAAHTMHPVAAQGFNLALFEVAVLAEALRETPIDLESVEKRICAQEKKSVNVSHQLTRMFSPASKLAGLWQVGMIGLDMALPLKRSFIERLIGRSGNVPDLLLSVNE